MKRYFPIIAFLLFFFAFNLAEAQVPNSQRKKPVKKVAPKPVAPAPVVVAPVIEPTKEETEAWIIEKILKYKPIVYITSSIPTKNNCEWLVTNVAFNANDNLILTIKADPASTCYKDQLIQVEIDIRLLDMKRTNSVETTKRVLLFPLTLTNPFTLTFAPASAMNKTKFTHFNTIIAFDKGAAYEPNLATRLAKAISKMNEFTTSKETSKEAY